MKAAGKPLARRRGPDSEGLSVAVCIDTRDGPGRERLLGVYRYALERNWRLILVRNEDAAALRQMEELPLDGAILYDRAPAVHRFLRRRGAICVEVGARNLRLDHAAVFTDSPAIARLAAEHLAAAGVQYFGYCGLANRYQSLQRARHFALHGRRLGIQTRRFDESTADGELNLQPLIRWLKQLPRPVGVLAYDDKMAERVLAACRWAKIAVPDQVAVLGIGNDELICELAYPRLSSVTLPTREIGWRAAALLESIYCGKKPGQRWWALPPLEVITRASTDRLPSAHPAVLAAIAFMRAEYRKPIGTDQVAAAVGMPRRTLERRFQASRGQTVHAFLVEMRLRHARELLRQSDISLSAVALQCGYGALSAFTRMFTARTGCHPETYRGQYQQKF